LVDAVHNAIETFEPRLGNVRVHLSDDRRANASLQFSIHADLELANSASPVGFDAWFESMSLQFAVSPSRGRVRA
jgi:predicted component of type VI protein secretion system